MAFSCMLSEQRFLTFRHSYSHSYGFGSFGGDSKPALSFHERMMAASKNERRSRSRSPDRSSGWVDNSGSFDAGPTKRPSFHDIIMEQAQLSKQEAVSGNATNTSDCKSYDDSQSLPEKSVSTTDAGQAITSAEDP